MFDHGFAFDSAGYLALLVLLPILWVFSYRGLSGLGRVRRLVALGLRTVVLVLIILALAETQHVRTSDRMTVIYLLDQSLSIPEARRREMVEYFNASVERHRDDNDRVALIAFGRAPAVEIPPIDYSVKTPLAIESLVDPEYTDLASAMQLALALFPSDAAKRVVLVTDGNQNMGNAREQALALADAGVGIDVAPIFSATRGEVAIEKLAIPSNVRRGQPFDMKIVLNNTTEPTTRSDGVVRGTVRVVRKTGSREETLVEQPVVLEPGKRFLSIREEIDQPEFYTYEARFFPDDPIDDAMPQNNRATAFTHVRGKGHVLLIEDWDNPGEFDFLVERLRNEDLEVTVQTSDQLFSSLAELQRYDTVVLANVPRSSGDDATEIAHFSNQQISMLVRNTQQMGSGLIMMGGPNSFGAGGWRDTELEKAMPVDFEIKSAKVVPVGALALMMHASEMPQGNHWQKVVAGEAIKALGSQDYVGLIHWSGTDQWLWGRGSGGIVKVGPARRGMMARLDRMTPGDMPQFDPALKMAAASFAGLPSEVAVKHMIIISDGDPSPPSPGTIRQLINGGVKVTTVAIGSHGMLGSTIMQRIATQTGGKYYKVRNARALPKIYQREARRISRPLRYEDENGLLPQVRYPHEMIQGLEGQIPPITGFMLTTVKENPLVEVSLVSPKPGMEQNATILASWTYGLGKAAVLTTDAGYRWATAWTGWENYDKLMSQIVRWSMRPTGGTGNFHVATDVGDGRTQLVITALDKDDEYLNFLNMTGTVVGPDMQPIPVKVEQTAPGRYVGEFESSDSGSYFVMINPGPGQAPIRTGVDVAYSDEFRNRETNSSLLESLAALSPKGGGPGQVIDDPTGQGGIDALVGAANPFRRDLPKATASQDIWYLLVLIGGCLFFFDVFIRRVHVNFAWVAPLAVGVRDTVLRRESAPVETKTMDRLKSRKAEVDDRIEQRRATARFEIDEQTPDGPDVLEEEASTGKSTPPKRSGPKIDGPAPEQEEETYTERLLKAKQRVWENRKKPNQ